MKVSLIKKFQSGGSPFAIYTPVPLAGNNTAASSTTGASSLTGSLKDNDLTDKDLLKMLGQIDGLPSDMNAIMSSISKLYSNPFVGDSISATNLNTRYVQALNLVKTAKFNKEQYDDIKKKLSQDSINEVAIDTDGRIVVMDKDKKISRITIDKFKLNLDKYTPLTNQDLLDYRAYNAPMDNTILSVVSNGVGMDLVNKYILSIINKLGTSKNTLEGYTKKSNTLEGTLVEGCQILTLLAEQGYDLTGNLDGLYKSKIVTESLVKKAKQALNYLYKTMPDNMKTLLEFKTGSKENALATIAEFVSGVTNETKDFGTNMILDAEGKKPGSKESSGKSGGDSTLEKMATNAVTNIVTGRGGSPTTYTLLNKDGQTLSMNGVSIQQFDLKGDLPKEGSVYNLMQSIQGGILRGGNFAVTFGNLVISDSDMRLLTYKNDGNAIRTILPIKQNEQGKIVPDLEFMEIHSDLIKLINSKGLDSPEVLLKLKEAGILNEFTGEIDTSKFAPFLCINGLGTNRNLKESNFISEITDDKELETEATNFNNLLYSKDGNEGKEFKFDFDFKSIGPWDWFGMHDKLYKGTIFIPITTNLNQALAASNQEARPSEGLSRLLETANDSFNLESSLNDSSSNLLGI